MLKIGSRIRQPLASVLLGELEPGFEHRSRKLLAVQNLDVRSLGNRLYDLSLRSGTRGSVGDRVPFCTDGCVNLRGMK